jgi:3,4-dihydroxy 2-butanone 4-phosphate synthase/GTP cyclohydrolase II
MFPLRYREGGVLKRAGHTEASIDLCRLADVYPAAVIGELVNDDGSMTRSDSLRLFSQTHAIPLVYIADLVRYRRRRERLIHQVSSARIPTDFGVFTSYVYRSILDNVDHIAFVKGEITDDDKGTLVRVHSECLTGDVFGSRRCDCGEQLQLALQMIAKEGSGVVVYLRGHEGRGIGLGHKVSAYQLQDNGRDTVEANIELGLPVDSREYGLGAQILSDLGVKKLRLMTNNPAKYNGLEGYDLDIVARVPLVTDIHHDNIIYLRTKREKLGHLLSIPEGDLQATSPT